MNAKQAEKAIRALLSDKDRETLNQALTEIHSIRQAVGSLGLRLRRTKPGSKRHKEYWDDLTKLESSACEYSSKIRFFLQTGLVL